MKPFAKYLNRLQISPRPDGATWMLDHSFEFMGGPGWRVIVPAGFVTDLASIPRIFWNILPPFGKYTEAAVVHDWCYRNHLFTRAISDAILLQGMGICRVGPLTRWTIYLAVRLFGGHAWRDEKRQRKYGVNQA